MTFAVTLRQVRKVFGTAEVIRGVDLDIVPGEFLVLVGPSGCGKSTLLRMIAGLEEVSSGEIAIDGSVVNDIDPADRDIAMVFQSYALYPHMTVRENLAFGLNARGLDAAAKAKRIEAGAAILELGALLDRHPRSLSGGQQQRVAMGRAMVRDPIVFLFDEPLSNLDAKLRAQMRLEVKALHKRLKTTAIYVTHDQVEAMTMADRIVMMRNGEIEQIGKPLDLYDRPATAFVAQFIGSPTMNMLRGTAKRNGITFELESPDGLNFRLPPRIEAADGQPIILGLRPEHLSICDDGLPCKIEHTETLGREILLYGTCGRAPICIAPGNRPAVQPGDTIGFRYELDHANVFDSVSERNLVHGN